MKASIKIILILLLFSKSSFSQQDTKDILLAGLDSGREMSAYVDPNFHKHVVIANTNWKHAQMLNPTGMLYQGYSTIVTNDGGKNWQGLPKKMIGYGYNTGTGPTNYNSPYAGALELTFPTTDPTSLIDRRGNYLMSDGTIGKLMVSANQGGSWISRNCGVTFTSALDKSHAWVDNYETSTYKNRIYMAATHSGNSGVACGNVTIIRSDDGLNWTAPVDIPGFSTCYVNMTTDKNGFFYVIGSSGNSINIAKSVDGGGTFTVTSKTITGFSASNATSTGCTVLFPSEWTFLPNPVILADVSDENNSGNLYIVFGGTENIALGYNVFFIKSSDNGVTWTSPARIDNSLPSTKLNFLPWATCDPETGTISVLYYSNKNQIGCNYDVYVSSSTNAGSTWTQTRMNDFPIDFSNGTFLNKYFGGRIGEYNAIASSNGIVYPFWNDTRNNQLQVYTSPFVVPACNGSIPTTKTITTNTNSIIKEKASSQIFATNQILTGSKVKYVAGSSIELNTGFSTDLSGTDYFSAYINEGCATPTAINKFSVMANSPICTGKTINLKAENIVGATYAWIGPLGFTNTNREPTISNVTTANSGRYTCVATLAGGGTLTDFIDIIVGITPNKAFAEKVCGSSLPFTLNVSDPSNDKVCYWMYAPFSTSPPNSFYYLSPNTFNPNPSYVLYQYSLPDRLRPMPGNPVSITTSSYTPNNNIDITNGGFFKCEVGNNGCVSETNIITVYPKPTLTQNGNCCSSTSLSVTNTSNYPSPTYIWKDPNGTTIGTTSTINLNCSSLPGVYSCTVSTNGCQYTNTVTASISNCLGRPANNSKTDSVSTTQTKNNLNDIKIFPNPTSGIFKISSKNKLLNPIVELINENGQIVFKKTLSGKVNIFEVELPNFVLTGTYIVKIKSIDNSFTSKLMVQKAMMGIPVINIGESEEQEEKERLGKEK